MIQWSESEYTDNTAVDAALSVAKPTACHTAPRSLSAEVISSICILMPFVITFLPTSIRVGKNNMPEMKRYIKPMCHKNLCAVIRTVGTDPEISILQSLSIPPLDTRLRGYDTAFAMSSH